MESKPETNNSTLTGILRKGEISKWDYVRLGHDSIANIIMGQSPDSSTYNNHGEGLPFLQGVTEFGSIYPSPTIYCNNPLKKR